MEKLLSLSGVELIYHSPKSETHALTNLNLEVNQGEFISIVGPSGCGKTTILSLIAGILKPTSGEIFIGNEKVEKINSLCGYMFQRDNLFEWLSIWKNVTLGLSFKKRNTEENREYAKSLLEKYGLKDFISHYPQQLSGGQQQRMVLLLCTVKAPELLILDEPSSAIDLITLRDIADFLQKLKGKTTIIMVAHSRPLLERVADLIVEL